MSAEAAGAPGLRPVPFGAALGLCLSAGRSRFFAHLALVVVQAALPLAGLYAMQWLIDAVAAGVQGTTPQADAFTAVLAATGLAAGIAVVGNLVRSLAAVVAESHGRALADASAQRLQEHAAGLDLAEFDRAPFHDLLHQAGTAASQRPVRLVADLAGGLSALVSLVLMGTVLGFVEVWLPFVVVAAALPLAWARRHHARAQFRWQQVNVHPQRDVGYLGALLTGRASAKDVRALRLGGWFAARLSALRAGVRRSLHALAAARARDDMLVQTLASLAMFGAYVWLGHLALAGALTLGGLVLHAQAVQRAQNGIRDLLSAAAAIGEDRLFLRPFVDLLATRAQLGAAPPAANPPAGAPAIAAHGVHFTYPDSPHAALTDVTFALAPGERVAIAGPNGSGKSTLVKLLCRLYDPTTGNLAANGTDLRHMTPDAWRAGIAVLFQDASGFELTLGENLRLGHATHCPDAELWRALDVAGLAALVKALPLQLDTPLSRRISGGVELSGGELRRLLLARALAQPASLLVLDEPFAQLDGVAAERLAAELAARSGRQTIVVVDHRATAVRCVDRVLLLEHGRLVASGSPAELSAGEPRFRALFPDA